MKRWIKGVIANSGDLAWWFLVFDGAALLIIGAVMVVIGLTTGAASGAVGWLAVGLGALMVVLGLWMRSARLDLDA